MDVGYITNGITQDGFGARLQRAIGTMAFTYYLRDKFNVNLEYVHTPFAFEGFGEDYSKEEKARGLYDNYEPYNEVSREGYLKRAILWDDKMCYSGTKITDINFSNLKIIDTLDFNKEKLFIDISNKETNNKLYFIKYLSREFNSGQFDVNIIDTYFGKIRKNFQYIIPDINNEIV